MTFEKLRDEIAMRREIYFNRHPAEYVDRMVNSGKEQALYDLLTWIDDQENEEGLLEIESNLG